MSKVKILFGKFGEDTAARILKEKGYKILKRNYKTRFAEIDIIAEDKDTLCFVEVKSRTSDRCGRAAEAVTLSKQKKIYQAALLFLKENNLWERKARFDVLAIDYSAGKPEAELIQDAFQIER